MSKKNRGRRTPKHVVKRPQRAMLQSRTTVSISSPVIPPGLLDQYRQVDHTYPERIMVMTEKEQDHRHARDNGVLAYENRKLELAARLKLVGMLGASVVTITMTGASVYMLSTGQSLAGVATLLTGIGTAVSQVFGKKKIKSPADED